jgi:hypothetical protein
MDLKTIVEGIAALPSDKREEVADFVAFLRSRARRDEERVQETVVAEPTSFVGMWADRADMADSVHWVRRLREREWGWPHV